MLQQLLDHGAEVSGRTVTEERCLGCAVVLLCLPACLPAGALSLLCVPYKTRAASNLFTDE